MGCSYSFNTDSSTTPSTSISARALGTSGTSAGPFPTGYNAETSFVKDTTFRDVTLNDINYFLATKVIASKQNEISNMSGGKSLDLELNFFSDVYTPISCSRHTTYECHNYCEPS